MDRGIHSHFHYTSSVPLCILEYSNSLQLGLLNHSKYPKIKISKNMCSWLKGHQIISSICWGQDSMHIIKYYKTFKHKDQKGDSKLKIKKCGEIKIHLKMYKVVCFQSAVFKAGSILCKVLHILNNKHHITIFFFKELPIFFKKAFI